MEEQDFLKKNLQQAAESGAEHVEVDDMLWQSIEARLEPKRKRRGFFFIMPCLGWAGLFGAGSLLLTLWLLLKPAAGQAPNAQEAATTTQSLPIPAVAPTSAAAESSNAAPINGNAAPATTAAQTHVSHPSYNTSVFTPKSVNQKLPELATMTATNPMPVQATAPAAILANAPANMPASIPAAGAVTTNQAAVACLPFLFTPLEATTTLNTKDVSNPKAPRTAKAQFFLGLYGGANTLRMRPFTDDPYFIEALEARKNATSFNLAAAGGIQKRWNGHLGWRVYGAVGFSRQRYRYRLYQLENPTLTTALVSNSQIRVEITYGDTVLLEQRQFVAGEIGGDLLLYPWSAREHHLYAGPALRYNAGGSGRLAPVWRAGAAIRTFGSWELHGGMSWQPYAAPWSYFETRTIQWEFGVRRYWR